MDLLWVFSVLCLLCLCDLLFVCALSPPAGKGLISWFSFMVSNCEFVTCRLVSWVMCGSWLYRFLVFEHLFTLLKKSFQTNNIVHNYPVIKFRKCLQSFWYPWYYSLIALAVKHLFLLLKSLVLEDILALGISCEIYIYNKIRSREHFHPE